MREKIVEIIRHECWKDYPLQTPCPKETCSECKADMILKALSGGNEELREKIKFITDDITCPDNNCTKEDCSYCTADQILTKVNPVINARVEQARKEEGKILLARLNSISETSHGYDIFENKVMGLIESLKEGSCN